MMMINIILSLFFTAGCISNKETRKCFLNWSVDTMIWSKLRE